ncbi:DUF6544 family protein (plasmid) [Haladaptatus sp. SPP-AMP-3]|uniref:DUF6920 family protein n=1 Tax=Haladaptatus sp. SPP-AMP-3 TaxID=3121295 RepID=UPI003C2B2391
MSNRIRVRLGAVIAFALAAVAAAIAAVALGNRRIEDEIETHVDELLSDSEPRDGRFSRDDIEDLPAPVRRYFTHVLEDGQPHVQVVRLHQRGEFRLGGPDSAWRPLVADQYVTTRPPGFVWDANIDVLPRVPARVLDCYEGGDGVLRAWLVGGVPVANAGPSPEMDAGELLRYLAEAVWYPTALLPAQGVEWEAIDGRSARATLEHRSASASVVFHFNEHDEIERVTAERYRMEDERYESWTGHFRDYRERNGRRIPVKAEVGWGLPDDVERYWRATIDRIEHRPMGTNPQSVGEP